MEELLNNIKQEPEVNFVLILPPNEDQDLPHVESVIGESKAKKRRESIRLRKCPICNITLKSRALKLKHLADIHGNKFGCKECPYVARTSGLLSAHRFTHFKRFSCETCSKKCSYKNILRDHQMHHKHGIYATIPEVKFKCKTCKKEFASHYRLHAHEFIMHDSQNAICDICGKTVKNKEYIRRHMFQHAKAPCEICQKLISNLTIKRHLIDMHTERLMVECEFCQKTYRDGRNLKIHVNLMHSAKPILFKCKICGHTSKSRSNLKLHIKKMHNNIESESENKEKSIDHFIERLENIKISIENR